MRTIHLVAGLLTLFTLSLAGLACSGNSSNAYSSSPTGPAPPPHPASGNTVLMSGMAFSPASITVAVGTTITWKNNDGFAHTSSSDTGVWDTGNIAAGGTAATTFKTAGTFTYNCKYHASMGMRGTVIVR